MHHRTSQRGELKGNNANVGIDVDNICGQDERHLRRRRTANTSMVGLKVAEGKFVEPLVC